MALFAPSAPMDDLATPVSPGRLLGRQLAWCYCLTHQLPKHPRPRPRGGLVDLKPTGPLGRHVPHAFVATVLRSLRPQSYGAVILGATGVLCVIWQIVTSGSSPVF